MTGERLTNSPEQLYQAGAAVPLLQHRVTVSVRLHGMSARKTLAGNETPGYAITSVGISLGRRSGAYLAVHLDNVFGEEYGDPVDTSI